MDPNGPNWTEVVRIEPKWSDGPKWTEWIDVDRSGP